MKTIHFTLIVACIILVNSSFCQRITILPAKTFISNLNDQLERNQATDATPKPKKPPLQDFTESIYAQPEAPQAPPVETGTINWTQGVLEAKGRVYLNAKHVTSLGLQYAQDMALSGAEADARANLLASIQAVNIHDTVRVVDKMVEKKVTVQILDGSIKARRVGEPIYGNNWVEVTMRCDLDGEQGSVTNFLNQQKMMPEAKQSPITETQQQEQYAWYLNELKNAGLIEPNSNAIPPVTVEIPKEQASNYQPKVLPTIGLSCKGKVKEMDMSKYFQINDPKAIAIVNASRDLIGTTGLTGQLPLVNGYIKDGNIEIDLCALLKNENANIRTKKVLEGVKKYGSGFLQILSMVAMFI
jgi:hypothetical protein